MRKRPFLTCCPALAPAPAPRKPSPLAWLLWCAGALGSPALPALELGEVRIEGVTGAPQDNIRARLSLAQHPEDEPLTEARLSYLLRQAPGEVLGALEPFGYYDATLQVHPERSGEVVAVRIVVTRGEPVRVRSHAIT